MGKVIIIAAVGKNNELGKNNDLIWRIKEDLQFFKNQTTGSHIAMGYNTFYSLRQGELLPNRIHLVLTSKNLEKKDKLITYSNFEDFVTAIQKLEKVYIIGGSMVFTQMLDYANEMILTEIDEEDLNATVFFPKFDKNLWEITKQEEFFEENIKYKRTWYKNKLIYNKFRR